MSPVRAVLVTNSCSRCARELAREDNFCDQCGAPARQSDRTPEADRSVAAPALERPSVHTGPDLALVRTLVQQAQVFPVAQALRAGPGAMCLACGVDLEGDPTAPCPSCGTPTVLSPDSVPSTPMLGTLHPRRAGLRKRPAMLVGRGPNECTLLLHNGKLLTVAPADLPPAVPVEPGVPRSHSPVGPILRHADAVTRGASLPWTDAQLLQYAFGALGALPWARRPAALDVLALGRPDLLGGCGLSPTETTWLGLVHAARHGDHTGVVAAVAALPPDRYRRKIAVVTALLGQLRLVPGAAERLAPALRAFEDAEPLAAISLRALGISECTPRQRLDDQTVRAGTFPVPVEIVQLLGGLDTAAVAPRARALLGTRGRLAMLYTATEPDPEPAVLIDLRGVPLAVLDDLVDAGKLTDLTAASAARSAVDKAYLTARLAPERLSDAQVEDVGHRDEAIRRRMLSGDTEPAPEDAERPLALHVAAAALLRRRRPQDLVTEHVLPAHREVARRLADMITRVDAGEEPAALLTEPVLADRSTWLALVGLFGAERLRGASRELIGEYSEFFEWLDLIAAREHLYLADWQRATDAARRCLELATAEAVRDEAQNLLACGLHNLGDHQSALSELEHAIEGTYSVALLANIGVVAAHLDPELAARHLARIVREGPTIAMRVNAVRQAVATWQSDGTKIWAGDAGERRTLPTVLREPLRSIVVESIDLEDFRMVASALATYDGTWFAAPNSLRGSPHRNTLEARYYVAHAAEDMFGSVIEVLGTVKDWDSAPEWLVAARDNLVHQTVDFLLEHIDDPDNVAGTVAFSLVTKVRGLSERDQVVLAFLAVATVTYHLTEQDAEISDNVIALYRRYAGRQTDMDEKLRAATEHLAELCVRRLALNLAFARQRELAALTDPYNTAIDILARVQRGTPLWFQVRRQVAEVVEACQRTKAQLRPWLRELESADARDMIMDFLENCGEFELKAQRVLGS